MQHDNIMVDLETLSTESNAMIVAIGAVTFSQYDTGETFYQPIDICARTFGQYHISPSTTQWWMAQNDDARAVFHDPRTTSLAEALTAFASFVQRFTSGPSNVRVWGNGAAFDNVILANAYRSENLNPPWKFYNDRCYRTYKAMAPSIQIKHMGTHHNARDDALSQAQHLLRVAQALATPL